MFDLFRDNPGRLFLLATLLPLLAFTVLLLAGFLNRLRKSSTASHPSPIPGYFAVALMMTAAAAALIGTSLYFEDVKAISDGPAMEARWGERIDWVRIGSPRVDDRPAMVLQLGYRIDRLTALLVSMVTFIGSLIFLFSIGYMKEELHEVHDHSAHVHRHGRFGRFFLYLSLFAFSMLNLLIADNLLQVFIGWELVGVCSFFLIGFYYERKSASTAANKAFIVNRIGDAGFLVGLALAWNHFGTFNIQELIAQATLPGTDPTILMWMGLGILAGCVGKSAQVPLQTWLPDAMEGPTPVSALIHAATMVAAGVYLVGRTMPLFTDYVLEVTAILGLATLFISATIACVQNDIKRVLAYSTCSQLGYMMMALGLGGWVAGELHLLTHAFFKALLFLGAGAVIFGLHHEQDLTKMGGLRRKMPITAYTMLIGVFAIAGVPLFSGWYSKDMILGQVAGAGLGEHQRPILFALPFLTAGLTSYYMFRLWFLAFAGEPRDKHVYEHAHEAPLVMTVPLMILAVLSVGIAWGWPVWDVNASCLGKLLHAGEPAGLATRFSQINHHAHEHHLLAGGMAFLAGIFGFGWALMGHRAGTLLAKGKPSLFRRFLLEKWYFDPIYDATLTKPTVRVASLSANFDKNPAGEQPFDTSTLDGALNTLVDTTEWSGDTLRQVQTGRLREYALALGLTIVIGIGILIGLTR